MINNPTSALWELEKAVEVGDIRGLRGLRQQAASLLARLNESRSRSEQRALETGYRDPMKAVTGRSALDAAIAATRNMVDRMDELLYELNGELEAEFVEERSAADLPMGIEVGSGT